MHENIERVLVSEEELHRINARLGAQITTDYAGKNLLVVGILKGSVLFMADLIREIQLPCKLDFLAVSSYGGDTRSSGVVKIVKDIDIELEDYDVLLVEDNELNREIAVEIIGSTGITIDTAINGLDAVHKVAQSEEGFYQIILMDIQMPIMDGYEATRQIRSLQRRDIAHMPIIAMTANAFSEDVTNAIKAGMNYHLAKPIDIGALMGILSKYLQAPA